MIQKLIAVLLSLTTFGLIVGNIIVSSNYTTSGLELKQLEQQKQQLQTQNRQLQEHILSQTSIQNLEKISQSTTFVDPETIVNIQTPKQPVALNQ